ncbi:hypothetical protein ILUMI_02517 [Ignelater luminosus]|uniref:Uncharacterized protein n=1 Tax=Ignelater luminosus TaxID=2038154 RepID=A0A8K0GN36_IGNLU|nr:hypothetical protein ILUMI_02517 [Ignelater luminosus]
MAESSSSLLSSPQNQKHDGDTAGGTTPDTVIDETPSQVQSQFASDIRNYVGQVNVDDLAKSMLLERHWTPPLEYNLPHCVVAKKGKETRKCAQKSHFDQYHWLVLSHKDQGLYSKYCVLLTTGLDLKRATDALSVLEQKRQEADYVFQQLISEAQKIAEQMDVKLKIPRTSSRQRHQDNHPAENAETFEEYFRKAEYIPLLDSIIFDLKNRLSPDVMDLFKLKVFLPRTSYTEEDLTAVRKVLERYEGLLGAPASVVIAELRM